MAIVIYDCKSIHGRLSSNVDGHVDNYLVMLCSMSHTIVVRNVNNKKKTAMNHMTCLHYPVHCLAYCPIYVYIHMLCFILCYVIPRAF